MAKDFKNSRNRHAFYFNLTSLANGRFAPDRSGSRS